MSLSTPVAERRSVLDFCLAPLRSRLGDESAGDVPSRLEIHGQVLELDTWEQATLQDGASGKEEKPWSTLVIEGIAFRVGCKLKLEAEGNVEELITFASAGYALVTEMQQLVDLLIVAGEVATAKKLSLFRNKLIGDLKQLGEPLDDASRRRAELAAEELIGTPQSSFIVSSSSGASPTWAGEYKPRKRRKAGRIRVLSGAERERRRLRRMSLFLFASTLIWLIFFMPRLFEPEPRLLAKPQFEHLPAIQSVTARPPSLFVEVQSQAWDALAEQDRQKLIEEVGRIAVAAEYNGVQFKRDQGGAVVGRWLRAQGAQLVNGS